MIIVQFGKYVCMYVCMYDGRKVFHCVWRNTNSNEEPCSQVMYASDNLKGL